MKDHDNGLSRIMGTTSSDSEIAENRHRPVSRRTIVRGAAWTVPVVAVAVAAPASVASGTPCVSFSPTQAGWTLVDPVSGQHQNAGATNIWRTVDGIWGYRQKNDNYYRDNNPAAQNYVTSLETTFTAVAGTTYVFTFNLIGNNGQSQDNIVTTMDVMVGGTSLQRFSTQPTAVAGMQVPMGPVNATTGSQQYSVIWVAPSSGLTTFQYVFTMYPVSSVRQITYNDDIWVSPALVTQPDGCV